MKEYNYDEIRQMQEKALERVRDMQAKTNQLINNDSQKSAEHKAYRDNFYNAVKSSSKADYIKMPVEIDKGISDYESFERYFTSEGNQNEQDEKSSCPETSEGGENSDEIVGLLEKTGVEPDKALLMSLLLLLQADKAQEDLLMSLIYILI